MTETTPTPDQFPYEFPDKVLARISPSSLRRALGIIVLSTLGGLLVYLALVKPPEALLWQAFLLILGAATLYLADALRRATAGALELRPDALRDGSGRIVAYVKDIHAVERGAFAIKPSNGFLLRLNASQPGGNVWAPGLWWRLGRRIGVGGITSASEAKAVAEILAALVVARKTAEMAAANSDGQDGAPNA